MKRRLHSGVKSSGFRRISAGGFSLVELLIAMTLGLLLMSGMIAVFAGNKRSSEINTAMADIQENVRFALEAINEDVRMAGHQGCASLAGGSIDVIANRVPMSDPSRGLTATAISASVVESATNWDPKPALGTGVGSFQMSTDYPAIPGTHALIVQFGGPDSAQLSAQLQSGSAPSPSGPIILDAVDGQERPIDLQAGELAIISDCQGGELFRATNVNVSESGQMTILHGASMNDSGAFQVAYGSDNTLRQTRVMPFVSNVFYVGDTGLENEQGDKITALYQQSLPYNKTTNPPTELVQGVENLRVSFGVRDSFNSLQYIAPDDAAFDSLDVRSVRIGILMASYDRIADVEDESTYVLAGQAIEAASNSTDATTHAKDKRFRLAFNTTIKVRNLRDSE